MRFGYWMPVFGGWLRNVDDESMDASFAYNKKLARRTEAIGWDLTLIAELFLNDIKGISAPCLDAWTTAAAVVQASRHGAEIPLMSFKNSSAISVRSQPIASVRRASFLLYANDASMLSSSTLRSQPPNTGIQ